MSCFFILKLPQQINILPKIHKMYLTMENILAEHTPVKLNVISYNSVDLFEENELSRDGFESVSYLAASGSACFLM